MKKKSFLLAAVLTLFIASVPITASASDREQQLNDILSRNGVPSSHISEMTLADKQFIIKNSGENFHYNGTSEEKFTLTADGHLQKIEPPAPGTFQPMGTISTTDLTLKIDDFSVIVNGVTYKDVYPSFAWTRGAIASNDSFGVAVPDGWAISSGTNSCQTQSTSIYNYGTIYEKWDVETNCGGRPALENIFGITWSSFVIAGHGTAGTGVYKGTSFLRVRKVNSSAINRFVGSYVHDISSNATSTYGVTLGYGAIAFTLSGSSGNSNKIDTGGFSKDIIW